MEIGLNITFSELKESSVNWVVNPNTLKGDAKTNIWTIQDSCIPVLCQIIANNKYGNTKEQCVPDVQSQQ